MKTDTIVKQEGMNALISKLGYVDAERFIVLLSREPFDYTKWCKQHLDNRFIGFPRHIVTFPRMIVAWTPLLYTEISNGIKSISQQPCQATKHQVCRAAFAKCSCKHGTWLITGGNQ